MTGAALLVLTLLSATDAGGALVVPAAEAPTLGVAVDRREARVGDPVLLTITAVSARTTPVNLPAALDLTPFAALEPRQESSNDLGNGRVQRRFVLSIAAYQPGDLQIPSVGITYLGPGGEVLAAQTDPVPIKIVSVLANAPDPQLKDNAAPVTVVQQSLLPVYIAGGLLAVLLGAGLALYLRRRWRARAAAMRPPPPPRPAHDIALEKLDRLGATALEGGDHRTFYFAVSEIIREYLGGRYGFDSLELTTEELIDELRRRAGRELVMSEIEGWLASCDLVKFAKISPSTTEARGMLEAAFRLIESTKPRPVPLDTEDVPRPTTGAPHG